MKPTVGVLALQGDVVDHRRMLEGAGAETRSVRRLSEIESLDGLVIPGGESTAMSHLLSVFELFEPLAELIKKGLPVYGSCAGMIMLASQVLDGRPDQRSFGAIPMTVRRNAFGRQVDSFESDIDFQGLEEGPYPGIFIRAPWVEQVGEGTEVLGVVRASRNGSARPVRSGDSVDASVDDTAPRPDEDRIVAVRSGSCLATSFHPEMTGDLRVHRYFLNLVRE